MFSVLLSSGRHAVRSKLVEVQLEYFFVFLPTSSQLEIFHFSSYCYWMATLFFQTHSLDMKSVTRNLKISLNATKRSQRRKRWLFAQVYLSKNYMQLDNNFTFFVCYELFLCIFIESFHLHWWLLALMLNLIHQIFIMICNYNFWHALHIEIHQLVHHLQRVTDEDIEALLSDEIFQPKVIWSLADVQV
jgi:hypothetical protein